MKRGLLILCALLLALTAGCSKPAVPAETTPAPTETPSPELPEETSWPVTPTGPQEPHEWAGQGLTFHSDALGLSVEFSPEWSSKIIVSEQDRWEEEFPLHSIRITLVNAWGPGEPNEGYAGSIFRFSESEYALGHKAESIPDDLFEFGQTVVLEHRDGDVIVLKAYNGTLDYEDWQSEGYYDCERVYNGLMNREFDLYFD